MLIIMLASRSTLAVAIGLTFSGWVYVSDAHAECRRYSVEYKQVSCFLSSTRGEDVNIHGDLAGKVICSGNDPAFVAWHGQPGVPLALPGSVSSIPFGINESGVIVGTMEGSSFGTRAFRHENGQGVNLGTLPGGFFSEAYGVSSDGSVVGYSYHEGDGNEWSHAFIHQNKQMIELPLPIGPAQMAQAINDHGQIAGWMGVLPRGDWYAEGFLWDDGVVTALGIPDGAHNSDAYAINNHGDIVLRYRIDNPTSPPVYLVRSTVRWRDGRWTDLGALSGFNQTYVYDINDHGDVVGDCSGNGGRAFIWRDGVMASLTDLMEPNWGGYYVSGAKGINNHGVIAGSAAIFGESTRAAILTPLPPKAGDVNCDWVVNVQDLLTVIGDWGPDAEPPQPFSGSPDLDGDGVVNVEDLLAVIGHWGS